MKAVAVLPGRKVSIHPADLRAREQPEDWLPDALSYKIPARVYRRLSVLRERTLRMEKHEANAGPHVNDPAGITAEELVRLPRETFEGIFEDDPYLGYQILKKVAVAVDHWLEGAVTMLLETPYIPDQA